MNLLPSGARLQRGSLAALLLCTAASLASASDLELNGGTTAAVPYGDSFLIELTGVPGGPAFVFGDASPGPVAFLGELVQIGGTPALFPLFGLPIPSNGKLAVDFPIPVSPTLSGVKLFMVGVVGDDNDPNGLDFSNGARLDIVPPVGAGATQTALVGRPAVLDGSGSADSDAKIPLGSTIFWTLVQQPPGSLASLKFQTSLFPVFTPDVAGDYVARITVTSKGVSSSAQTTVHAYKLAFSPNFDGLWLVAPFFNVVGTLTGPKVGAFSVNSVPVSVGAGGSFGPVLQVFSPGDLFQEILFEITHTDGTKVRERITVGNSASELLTNSSSKVLAAHLNQPAFNQVAQLAEAQFGTINIASILLGLPPTQIANTTGPFGITIFSATVKFTGLTFSSDIDVTLAPTASGVSGTVRLKNVKATFNVFGEIVEVDYSLSGSITSNPVDLSATLQFSAAPNGSLKVGVSNAKVVRNNFTFNLNGFLGDVAELFIIESFVKSEVEKAVAAGLVAELGPGIEAILSDFVISGNLLDLVGVNVKIDAPISGVVHSGFGATILLDGRATVLSKEAGAPAVVNYRSTPTAPPVFGSLTPKLKSYGAALATADDFINQILAAATGAGLLDGDLTSLLAGAQGGTGQVLTTEALGSLFPGAGFNLFPTGTQVKLRTHGTFPPVLQSTPGGTSAGILRLRDLEIVFEVPVPGGVVPLIVLGLDGDIGVNLSVDAAGSLLATLGNAAIDVQVLKGFPGSNLDLLQAGVQFLTGFILPTLSETLGAIPVPSLETQGLGVQATEISAIGGNSEYLGFFGNLVIVPGD